MSTKDRELGLRRTLKDRVRLFNKHVLNPAMLLAGTATLRSGGVGYGVTEPRIIDAGEAFTQVSPAYAQAWCRFGIDRYLRLTVSEEE